VTLPLTPNIDEVKRQQHQQLHFEERDICNVPFSKEFMSKTYLDPTKRPSPHFENLDTAFKNKLGLFENEKSDCVPDLLTSKHFFSN